MGIDVVNTNAELHEFEGLTLNNGAIVRMPSWAKEATVEYIPTAAGTGAVEYTLNDTPPSNMTGFLKTNFGDVSAAGSQVLSKVSYIAFEPASGTWTFRVLFKA
jgi:hypothetical protein